ncbi:hypothetical protein [Roseateles sp.]|uniref:hypothetical protein n=1 Tax=Roseateles sp. TaxID=1971397 RepID=UPI0032664FEC
MKKRSLLERLRAKKAARPTVFGVTWYSEENWSRVKEAATDPERFEATYVEWHVMAEAALAAIRKTGVHPVKVLVSCEELLPWCLLHGRPNTAASRAQFVSEKLRAADEARNESGA